MPAALVCLLPLGQLPREDMTHLLSPRRLAQLQAMGPAHPQYAQRLGAELALCAALRLWQPGCALPPAYGYDALGRPVFARQAAAPHGAPTHLSLSHCPGYAACALGDVPVGVDVELHRTLAPAMARLRSPAETARGAAFTLAHYVQKESYLKYLGVGLRLPMGQVTLQGDRATSPGHPAGVLHALPLGDGCAALCTPADTAVRCVVLQGGQLMTLLQ